MIKKLKIHKNRKFKTNLVLLLQLKNIKKKKMKKNLRKKIEKDLIVVAEVKVLI